MLEFTANVALFVPAGVLGTLWTGSRRWWAAGAVGLLLSVAIELTQALALEDRVADVRDVVANTTGAAAGALLLLAAERIATARRATAAAP